MKMNTWRSFGKSMMCTTALLIDASSSDTKRHHHFPDSQLVLDMATLSHAVYHLRNKVTSCRDGDDRYDKNNYSNSSNNRNQTELPTDNIFQRFLPVGTKCLYYSHDYSLGTQVLIVRSNLYNYIAVAYAGTDDWTTALTDGDILTSDFGPSRILDDNYGNNTSNSSGTRDDNGNNSTSDDDIRSIFNNVPDGIRVHRGFNEAVFNSNDFPQLLKCIASARVGGTCCNDTDDEYGSACAGKADDASLNSNPSVPYQLLTTGHSLGAADSVLLGSALHLAYPNENVRSINFGGPKIGNIAWSFWMNSLQPDKKERSSASSSSSSGSYEIFRFVNKIDLVPRLPELPPLTHAGHTLQMSVGGGIKVSVYTESSVRRQGYVACHLMASTLNFESNVIMPLSSERLTMTT